MKKFTIKFIITILSLSMLIGQNTVYSADISDHNPMALSIRVGVPDINKVARAVFYLCFDKIIKSEKKTTEFLEKIIRCELDRYNRGQNNTINPIINSIDFKNISFDRSNRILTIPYNENEEVRISQKDCDEKILEIIPRNQKPRIVDSYDTIPSLKDFQKLFKSLEYIPIKHTKENDKNSFFKNNLYFHDNASVYDLTEEGSKANLKWLIGEDIYAIIPSDSGNKIAVFSKNRNPKIFDLKTKKEILELPAYISTDNIRFSRDEDKISLRTTDSTKTIVYYLNKSLSGKIPHIELEDPDPILSINLNKVIIHDKNKREIRVLDISNNIQEIMTLKDDARYMRFTSNEETLCFTYERFTVNDTLYDLREKDPSKQNLTYLIGENITRKILSRSGKKLLVFYKNKKPAVFDLETKKEILQLPYDFPEDRRFFIKFSDDENLLYTPGYYESSREDYKDKVYNLSETDDKKRDLSYLYGSYAKKGFIMSHTGKMIAVHDYNEIEIFDIDKREKITTLKPKDTKIYKMSFSRDDTIFDYSNSRYIYNALSNKTISTLEGRISPSLFIFEDFKLILCTPSNYYGYYEIYDLQTKDESDQKIKLYAGNQIESITKISENIIILRDRSRKYMSLDMNIFQKKDTVIYKFVKSCGDNIFLLLSMINAGIIKDEEDFKIYCKFFAQKSKSENYDYALYNNYFSEEKLKNIISKLDNNDDLTRQAALQALSICMETVPKYITETNIEYFLHKIFKDKDSLINEEAMKLFLKFGKLNNKVFNTKNIQYIIKTIKESGGGSEVALKILFYFVPQISELADLLKNNWNDTMRSLLIEFIKNINLKNFSRNNGYLTLDETKKYFDVILHIEKSIRIRQPQASDIDLVNEDDIVAITKFLFSHAYDPDRLKAIFDIYFDSENKTTNEEIDKFNLDSEKKDRAAFYRIISMPYQFRETHIKQQRKLDYNFFVPFMLNLVNAEDTTTTYEAEIFFKLFTSNKLHQSRKEKPIVRKEMDLLDATFSSETKTFIRNFLQILDKIFNIKNCTSNQLDSKGSGDGLLSSEIAWELIHYTRLAQDLCAVKGDIKKDVMEKNYALEWKARVQEAIEIILTTDNIAKNALKPGLEALKMAKGNFSYFYKFEKVKVLYDLFNKCIYESTSDRKRNMNNLARYSKALPVNQDGQSTLDSLIQLVRSNLNYPEVVNTIHEMLIHEIQNESEEKTEETEQIKFKEWRYRSPDYFKMLTKHSETLKAICTPDEKIRAQEEKIKTAWEKNIYCKNPNDGDAHYYGITDDFSTLLNLGNPSYFNSCQATYKPDYNRGLSGTMANGWNKAVVAFDKNGKFLGRRILRLRLTAQGEFILIKEPTYGYNDNDPVFDLLTAKLAYDMGIKYQPDNAETISHAEFYLWKGNSGWEYSDYYGNQFSEDVGLVHISDEEELIAKLDIPLADSTQTTMPYEEISEAEFIQIANKIDIESAQDARMVADTSIPTRDFILIGQQLFFRGVPVNDLTIEEKDKKSLVELKDIDKERLQKYGILYKDSSDNKLYRIKPENLLIQKSITEERKQGIHSELNVISGEANKPFNMTFEMELMKYIHSLSYDLIPRIPEEKSALWYVISEDLIPVKIRMEVTKFFNRMNKEKGLKEKFKIVHTDKMMTTILSLSNNKKNEICAALSSETQYCITDLPDNVISMVFSIDDDSAEFVNVEAIVNVLRALYNKDSKRLIEIYKKITSGEIDEAKTQEIIKNIDNPKILSAIIIFNLRTLKNLSKKNLSDLKESLFEGMSSA